MAQIKCDNIITEMRNNSAPVVEIIEAIRQLEMLPFIEPHMIGRTVAANPVYARACPLALRAAAFAYDELNWDDIPASDFQTDWKPLISFPPLLDLDQQEIRHPLKENQDGLMNIWRI